VGKLAKAGSDEALQRTTRAEDVGQTLHAAEPPGRYEGTLDLF
jgi:hypothetical protein